MGCNPPAVSTFDELDNDKKNMEAKFHKVISKIFVKFIVSSEAGVEQTAVMAACDCLYPLPASIASRSSQLYRSTKITNFAS